MPSNISHIPSLTGKAILSLESQLHLSDKVLLKADNKETITSTFLNAMECDHLLNRKSSPLPPVQRGLFYVVRFTLTFGIIAVVAPLGTVVNGASFTFSIFALPSRYLYYTYTNQPGERTAARQDDWNRIKSFGDGFFRDLALGSTFHLSLLPLAMGYKLGAIYAISLTAYTAFSPDVALKLLAPAKVRAAFMKAILFRSQFGLVGSEWGLLNFDPERDDETSAGTGALYEKYHSLANEIRNKMGVANIDNIKWQGEDADSKDRFLNAIRGNVSTESYEEIKEKVEWLWILRHLIIECTYCREYSIFHDRREKAHVKIPIPDILTGVKKNSGTSSSSGAGSESPPPPRSHWQADLETALKMVRDEDKKLVISEANGLPVYNDPKMQDAYKVFRKGILNKMDYKNIFADRTNPYNKDAVLEPKLFYRKMALVFHPDKTQNFESKLKKEAEELFKLLNNAYARFTP